MFTLQVFACLLLASTALGHGLAGPFMKVLHDCNPPESVVGKFCAAVIDNDVDYDGDMDNKDFMYDLLLYNIDDDLCTLDEWEVVAYLTCRYGWSDNYARFMFTRFDGNGDGVVTEADSSGTIRFTREEFLTRQYTRFKDDYCGFPENRQDPLDKKLCAEVEALDPADVICDLTF